MAKLYYYENNENYQYGHGKLLKEDNATALFHTARTWHYNREEYLSIVSHAYEGYIGELAVSAKNCDTVKSDDMWLSPDPNYRGNVDNSFYGTLADFKEWQKAQENETEYERD